MRLGAAAGDDFEFDVMPYDLLRSEALRVLPEEVASGLEAFTKRGARGRETPLCGDSP